MRIRGAKEHLCVLWAKGSSAMLFTWEGKESAIVPL